jgi:hypothetical protein
MKTVKFTGVTLTLLVREKELVLLLLTMDKRIAENTILTQFMASVNLISQAAAAIGESGYGHKGRGME